MMEEFVAAVAGSLGASGRDVRLRVEGGASFRPEAADPGSLSS